MNEFRSNKKWLEVCVSPKKYSVKIGNTERMKFTVPFLQRLLNKDYFKKTGTLKVLIS